jgi:hypothetical protein
MPFTGILRLENLDEKQYDDREIGKDTRAAHVE